MNREAASDDGKAAVIVGYEQIQAATAILTRIAFSRGEGSDPTETLAAWRATEGFDEDGLERAADESSEGTISEIARIIDEGGSFTTTELREYVKREYMTALQIGWVARARKEVQARAEDAVEQEAAGA